MFTERERYLDNYDDVAKYLDEMNFHDYRVGGFDFDLNKSKMKFFIEEIIPGKKLSDSTGKVWDFTFCNIEKLEFNLDLPLGLHVFDIYAGNEPGEIVLEGHEGSIYVTSKNIQLGIPG